MIIADMRAFQWYQKHNEGPQAQKAKSQTKQTPILMYRLKCIHLNNFLYLAHIHSNERYLYLRFNMTPKKKKRKNVAWINLVGNGCTKKWILTFWANASCILIKYLMIDCLLTIIFHYTIPCILTLFMHH
jgi:hypothetical protein